MQLAVFQHCQQVLAEGFGQSHLDLRRELFEARQEGRENPVYHLRRGRDLEDTACAPAQLLRALAERADRTQDCAAVGQQLLAFRREHEPAADAIENYAEFVLEGGDLARRRQLRRMQTHGGLGHGAVLDDRREGVELPQVHADFMPLQKDLEVLSIGR